jgi:hypothetical protein
LAEFWEKKNRKKIPKDGKAYTGEEPVVAVTEHGDVAGVVAVGAAAEEAAAGEEEAAEE